MSLATPVFSCYDKSKGDVQYQVTSVSAANLSMLLKLCFFTVLSNL